MIRRNDHVITENRREPYATTDDLLRSLTSHRKQLRWLALFLTGEESMAEACLSHDALSALPYRQVFLDWIDHWARHAVIITAAKLQQIQIKEFAAAYRLRSCRHCGHPPLSGAELMAIRELPQNLITRLDTLCRFALIMRGVENYSLHHSALVLDVSRPAVNAAYCAALDFRMMLGLKNADACAPEKDWLTRTGGAASDSFS